MGGVLRSLKGIAHKNKHCQKSRSNIPRGAAVCAMEDCTMLLTQKDEGLTKKCKPSESRAQTIEPIQKKVAYAPNYGESRT